ncbi:nucleotide exchange factor GrpE [Nocardioides sp. CFH 31398]|uniref:nucleotide exchange factor GrpE n=1 Tax=Nocardioides sp. CFH 31398 TaxID=2919579 RepID=UPI001F05AD21|nr:nucleotide exchange factor GrpE [Nocardioides sp. CFH 31398]MCH1865034.1 nucleotide exchange factor GrpE [Nocardioides sp. CFH 31398]
MTAGDQQPDPADQSDPQAPAGSPEEPVEVSADPGDLGDLTDPVGEAEGLDEAVTDGDAASDELTVTRMELAERTADLQRLQAEFVNYKRRVERDRELLAQNSAYKVLSPVVEVLDTIDRAREHGEVEGGFKSVADQLERVVAQQGLVRFGEAGDPFDPNLHEALSHLGADEGVEVTSVKTVVKAGYRIGDRVVRAAQVLVVDPA